MKMTSTTKKRRVPRDKAVPMHSNASRILDFVTPMQSGTKSGIAKQTRRLPKLIVILGPTSSGKSALGVLLAKKFSGEIVSADSRQVYKGMDIGSGKITGKEMRGIPHYLLSVVSPKKLFTAEQYRKKALREIAGIAGRKNIPFLVGGTPFYIKAITENLLLPAVEPNIALRKKLEKKSAEELFIMLKKKDPRRAKTIDRQNKRRLIRALEIIETTEHAVPKLKKSAPQFDILILGMKRSSEDLKKRIAKRLALRLRQGMVAEVKKLHANGLSWEKLESFGMEYRFVAQFLQNKISRKLMISLIQKANEHYVKKQMLWWKNDSKIHWIRNTAQAPLEAHGKFSIKENMNRKAASPSKRVKKRNNVELLTGQASALIKKFLQD